MVKNTFFPVFLFFLICSGCTRNEELSPNTTILPQPQLQILHDGQFILSSQTQIVADEAFAISVTFLKEFIEQGSAIRFSEINSKTKIVFQKDKTLESDEAYTLDIQPKKIVISAKTDAGAFYAVQSLRQLLPESVENKTFKSNSVAIQAMTITDAPAFAYRGMHLDVGRHFFDTDFIKKYIDMLALLKMNTFHWHLTEDQGWRIEIKKYPKLQEIAAWRDETLVGHYNDMPHQFDGKKYGGFYTQEEVKEIVAYAASRHITVIPEIEMPGHSQAAIAAYPHLGCTGENPGVAKLWGVFEPIYCPKEETFAFLEDVLDEVIDLFPGTYIHIGGDEAPKAHWKNCENCQKRIKQEGLKDEHELQGYFIKRIEKYLNSKGRQIIGWDEILEGGLAPNATVMSWRGIEGAVAAAKQGNKVVMTPNSHCYFDYYQSENEGEPVAIGGFISLEKVYHFNPIPEGLTEQEAHYVLGAQGNVWTEYIKDKKHLEYMVFPRMVALSEVVWTNSEEKNYKDFVKRLVIFQNRLDVLNVNYANHLYEIKGALSVKNDTIFYTLETLLDDKTIRYTNDNTDLTNTSEVYENPLIFTENTSLQAAVFDEEKQLGSTFNLTFFMHQAVGKNIDFNVNLHPSYSSGGKNALINGVQGSNNRYGDSEWLGFWGDDVEIVIDLTKETQIKSVATRFFDAPGQWIYAPKEIQIVLLDENHNEIVNRTVALQNSEWKTIKAFSETFSQQARYIKLIVENYGIIPDGAQGAGHKAWTFIDEIVVE